MPTTATTTHTCDPSRCCARCHADELARLNRMANHPAPAVANAARRSLTASGCKCG